MSEKGETSFRRTKVRPFLKTLKHTASFAIQQLAISGTPDYFLCCYGTFVAMELKDTGGITSPLQKFNLAEVTRTRGVSIVASPENWESVKRQLRRLDRGEV